MADEAPNPDRVGRQRVRRQPGQPVPDARQAFRRGGRIRGRGAGCVRRNVDRCTRRSGRFADADGRLAPRCSGRDRGRYRHSRGSPGHPPLHRPYGRLACRAFTAFSLLARRSRQLSPHLAQALSQDFHADGFISAPRIYGQRRKRAASRPRASGTASSPRSAAGTTPATRRGSSRAGSARPPADPVRADDRHDVHVGRHGGLGRRQQAAGHPVHRLRRQQRLAVTHSYAKMPGAHTIKESEAAKGTGCAIGAWTSTDTLTEASGWDVPSSFDGCVVSADCGQNVVQRMVQAAVGQLDRSAVLLYGVTQILA